MRFFSIFAKKTGSPQVNQSRRAFSISAGVSVNEDSAMQVAAFYRGIIYISSQVAKLPWYIKDVNNKIQESQVSYLLKLAPNPETNSFFFRLLAVQTAIIHGNFIAEIERDSLGRPVAIWPIPTGSWDLIRDPKGNLLYRVFVNGYLPGTDNEGQTVYLKPKDVFHLRNFHTKDGLLGQGVVAYGKDVLGISLGADRMAGNLFANGGIPSGVIEVPGTLSDEAFERVKKSWQENHSGRKSAGVAVLEEGMKFTPVNVSPDVLQFLESRKFSVLEIARFLGLPPTKLFDTDANSYNTQEQSSLEVSTDTLDTWCVNIDMETDIKILSGQFGGRKSSLDIYSLNRGDMTTRSNYFSKMMQNGAINPNQIRVLEGMEPYEGGDRYYIAVNNFSPSDRIDEIIDSQVNKGTTQKDVTGSTGTDNNANIKNKLEEELLLEATKYLKGK